jgi:hypothetical protein
MVLSAIAALLDRDLRALQREVETYPDDASLWRPVPGITNVGGTLALHLTGNIQHYFGARLGGTGYTRDRNGEFARRNVPRSELLREIEAARAAVRAAASKISEGELSSVFPETVGGVRVQAGEYLIHLATHFAYHLGQLDYHRRMVTGSATGVDAMRPAELASARPV